MKHPIQPSIVDGNGVRRFKPNKIVRYLLDAGGINMNMLAAMPFDQNDREQFAQLIGYTLSGFSDLSYATDDTVETAEQMALGITEEQAKIAVLEEKLELTRKALRELVPHLFPIHPIDLA
jgi:hypothetical protein